MWQVDRFRVEAEPFIHNKSGHVCWASSERDPGTDYVYKRGFNPEALVREISAYRTLSARGLQIAPTLKFVHYGYLDSGTANRELYFKDPPKEPRGLILEGFDTDLFEFLVEHRQEKKPEARTRIAAQCVSLLCKLHDAQLVHGDIKPENFLLKFPSLKFSECDGSPRVALCDFEFMTSSIRGPETFWGTRGFISPERLKNHSQNNTYGSVSIPSDVYACGVVLVELLLGHFAGHSKYSGKAITFTELAYHTGEAGALRF